MFEYSGLEADPALPRAESQPGSGGSSAASHALLALEERHWDYTLTSTLDVKEKKLLINQCKHGHVFIKKAYTCSFCT